MYGHTQSACFGIPLAAENSDIARIDGAFKLLTSRDPHVQELAWTDLSRLVEARIKRKPTPATLAAFLSGSQEEIPRSTTNPISSIWSAARSASRRMQVQWSFSEDNHVSITHNGDTIYAGKRHLIFRTIRNNCKHARSSKLISYPSQRKAIECAAAAEASSHFFRDGSFTRFADWRFIHRARLNLLPLNAVSRRNAGTRGCRRCSYESETLPHVINHCMRYSRLLQKRHNAIVERVKKAATGRWSILTENQAITGQNLRPDLVLVRDDACLILDITTPFDNRRDAFDRARREKEDKYRPLVDMLKARYSDVRVEAIIVGSLGSWDPKNDRIINRLCSKRYAALMRKLIVSDTIRISWDIYVEHITGVQQDV
ncbi:uncharacterized protein LOC118197315 [Stegodyphus dumicola]|uniref:uncharacterized protein LOC118197315 n=1 Tax=Stegodyphus dumicola TaxID=202533 RepID=UPI0015ACF23A|nr:uncharacterized protein LOC118197315 [Stegodyphus dumicola]